MAKYVFIYAGCCIVASIALYIVEYAANVTLANIGAVVSVLLTIIPAKVFVNDFKEPPTKKQKHSFALGVLLVNAIAGALLILYAYGADIFSKIFLAETNVKLLITVVFIVAFALAYAFAYLFFGMFANMCVKDLKKRENRTD